MEIKTWHKVLFFGSITAFIIYASRQKIVSGAKYVQEKFGDLVSAFAGKWVGVKEIGNNQAFGNKVFEAMMKAVGWKSSDEWCMYFAKAVHYDFFKDQPQVQSNIQKILTGSTQQSFVNAKNDKTGTYTTSNTPKVGDIIIWQRSTVPWKGHAGVVTAVKDGMVETIEGNTDSIDLSNGQYVAKKLQISTVGSKMPDSTLVVRGYIRKLNV
jgi:surface antigen